MSVSAPARHIPNAASSDVPPVFTPILGGAHPIAGRSLSSPLAGLNGAMHAMLDALDVGVVALDDQTRVLAMNATAERLLGVSASAAKGERYDALTLRFDAPLPVADALEYGRELPARRTRVTLPDGRSRPVESSLALLRDSEGRPVGAVHVLKDLADAGVPDAEAERAARLASVGRLATRLAYEIRNPLTAITGFSQLLADDMPAEDPRRRFAENILSAVRELDRSLTATLVFAEAPRLAPRAVRADALLREAADTVRQDLAAKAMPGIEVMLDLGHAAEEGAEPPVLVVDADHLMRALLHLADNAIEAMPRGGRLTFRLSDPPALGPDHPQVRLSVSDTGEGIAPEVRQTLFEPFATTKPGGAGLGLALVKRVVELHGGRVAVESAAERGTTVHVDLPAGCAPQVAALPRAGGRSARP